MDTSSGQSNEYPTAVEVEPIERFERIQLLVRLLVFVGVGILQSSIGGLFGLVYFFLPVVAAILISRKGGAGFLEQDAGWITAALEWVIGLYAYLSFVSDRFPLDSPQRVVRLRVPTGGSPTVGSALLRLLQSLPHLLLLALLSVVSTLISLVAVVMILFTERYPDALRSFQYGLLAWTARLFAYHGSLVEPYPPFSLHTQPPRSRRSEPGSDAAHSLP